MNQILNDSNILSVMLISCLVSAVMAVMLLRIVIMVSEKYGLFDKPNERKVHKTPIPSMGGVSLMGGVFISLMFSLLRGIDTQLLSIYGCLFIISVVGLIDDLKDISARARFVIEFAIAAFLIYNGIEIKNWHHLFGTDELPLYLTHSLNMFLIVGMINAYNLVDGIDGLAGGLSFISITFIGTLFYRVGLYDYSILAFTLAAALATFMTFNANPAKIFLGDTGSLTLGMLIAVFVIKLWGMGKGYQTSVTQIDYWKIVLTLPAIPVLDALRVAIGRVAKGRSPFSADKTHIHHLLLKLGYKPFQASIVLWILQCTFVTVLLLIKPEGIWTEILMIICLYAAFYFAIIKMTQKLEIERRKILSKFDTI